MKVGFDATRRSRNVGTSKQGHGRDNRMVIPAVCHAERHWAELLGPHQAETRRMREREVLFLVEENSGGCIHACSVEDIARLLAHLSFEDWRGLNTFVLRQSTRKQRLLRPAWGRLYYEAELGLPGQKAIRHGPALVLEAVNCDDELEWPLSLSPHDRLELDRLRSDGHQVSKGRRSYCLTMTSGSVRATQVYRTLLHEIGHWVDFSQKRVPSEAYFARPWEERETFAHRYADAQRARLMKFGIIPFT